MALEEEQQTGYRSRREQYRLVLEWIESGEKQTTFAEKRGVNRQWLNTLIGRYRRGELTPGHEDRGAADSTAAVQPAASYHGSQDGAVHAGVR